MCLAAAADLGTDASSAEWAADILGNLTTFCGFLTFGAIQEATGDISLIIKIIVDFFCGIGAALATSCT